MLQLVFSERKVVCICESEYESSSYETVKVVNEKKIVNEKRIIIYKSKRKEPSSS